MDALKTRIFICLWVLVYACGCKNDVASELAPNTAVIYLKWNQSYPSEELSNAVLGLNWCLSHLGAKNTSTAVNGVSVSGTIITLNVADLGLESHGVEALKKLHQQIFNSEEYQHVGAIDLGRYITLLIGSSAHYYQITNTHEHLSLQLGGYSLLTEKGYVNNSSISAHHRIVQFSDQFHLNQLWVSTEIDSLTKEAREFETIEIMNNGQLKYAIYDADSLRINAPLEDGMNAGKPAKCMWCHESTINPLFSAQKPEIGYLTPTELTDTVTHFNTQLSLLRNQLINGVDFSQKQAHVQMELQYIMFKYPSGMRLLNEWQLNENELSAALNGFRRFTNAEFPFLPAGYNRNEIENRAPYTGVLTSTYVREKSELEVNYID